MRYERRKDLKFYIFHLTNEQKEIYESQRKQEVLEKSSIM